MNSTSRCLAILAALCAQPAMGDGGFESSWLEAIRLEYPKSCEVRLSSVGQTISGNNGLRIEQWSLQTCQGPVEYRVSYYPPAAFPTRKSPFEIQRLSNDFGMQSPDKQPRQVQGAGRFDEARWKMAEVGSAASERIKMLADLVASKGLRMLSRDAVRTLLGPPMSYDLTPEDEDWYVIEEKYHDEANKFEQPYLQRHLVIKYSKQGQAPSLLFIETAADVSGSKRPRVTRVPFR